MSRLLLLAVVLAGCAAAQPVALDARAPRPADRPRNVVLMIADGFGPASATLGAAAKGAPLAFDSLLVGAVETSATDSRVTDSAAGATAYACGIKTFNGAIAVGPDRTPCRTVLEAAEARGMATGLVATSRVTHATPASFAAHVPARAAEADIAAQMVGSGVDLLLGGGRAFFDARADGRDLLVEASDAPPVVLDTRADLLALDALAAGRPTVGLFAPDHLAYEIDRGGTDQPSLAEMTTRALDLLAASPDAQENGFFVMIEGSRIDHAGHANDPAAHLGDILAYDAAVAAALAWAAADGQTLVVSTADHETGGMTLGRGGIYAWDPAPLLAATASYDVITARVQAGADPADAVRHALGIDALPAGAAEALREASAAGDAPAVRALVVALASEPAGIGWTTSGHTAVDVGLYAFGPGARRFHGRTANDAVGRALFEVLGFRQ